MGPGVRKLSDGAIEPVVGFQVARWAPLPLRLIVGYGFMQHGYAKLARGPEAFAAILQALAVPRPHFMAWATIFIEIGGGLAVLLGAFVTLASLPLAAVMVVAIFTVHLPYGFSSIKLRAVTAAGAQFGPPGYESSLLYLACLVALVVGGAGPLAVDGILKKKKVRSGNEETKTGKRIPRNAPIGCCQGRWNDI